MSVPAASRARASNSGAPFSSLSRARRSAAYAPRQLRHSADLEFARPPCIASTPHPTSEYYPETCQREPRQYRINDVRDARFTGFAGIGAR